MAPVNSFRQQQPVRGSDVFVQWTEASCWLQVAPILGTQRLQQVCFLQLWGECNVATRYCTGKHLNYSKVRLLLCLSVWLGTFRFVFFEIIVSYCMGWILGECSDLARCCTRKLEILRNKSELFVRCKYLHWSAMIWSQRNHTSIQAVSWSKIVVAPQLITFVWCVLEA